MSDTFETVICLSTLRFFVDVNASLSRANFQTRTERLVSSTFENRLDTSQLARRVRRLCLQEMLRPLNALSTL